MHGSKWPITSACIVGTAQEARREEWRRTYASRQAEREREREREREVGNQAVRVRGNKRHHARTRYGDKSKSCMAMSVRLIPINPVGITRPLY